MCNIRTAEQLSLLFSYAAPCFKGRRLPDNADGGVPARERDDSARQPIEGELFHSGERNPQIKLQKIIGEYLTKYRFLLYSSDVGGPLVGRGFS
jgi:hypothetical protein